MFYSVPFYYLDAPSTFSQPFKVKQRRVMGVGMCLYTQLVQTKNKQCKSAIMLVMPKNRPGPAG